MAQSQPEPRRPAACAAEGGAGELTQVLWGTPKIKSGPQTLDTDLSIQLKFGFTLYTLLLCPILPPKVRKYLTQLFFILQDPTAERLNFYRDLEFLKKLNFKVFELVKTVGRFKCVKCLIL